MKSSRPWAPAAWARCIALVDTRLDRTVAIKILPPHLSATPESRERFQRGNGNQNSSTCCGEYIGPVLIPSHRAGSNNAGAYRVKLLK